MLLSVINRCSLLLLLVCIEVRWVNIGMGGNWEWILELGVIAGLLNEWAIEGVHVKSWIIK
jgi:hypothetical protein